MASGNIVGLFAISFDFLSFWQFPLQIIKSAETTSIVAFFVSSSSSIHSFPFKPHGVSSLSYFLALDGWAQKRGDLQWDSCRFGQIHEHQNGKSSAHIPRIPLYFCVSIDEKDGNKFFRVPEVQIKGTSIKYIRVTEECLETAKKDLEEHREINRKRPSGDFNKKIKKN